MVEVGTPNLIFRCWSNKVSRTEASIGENVVVSPVNPETPAAVLVMAAETRVAIVTLPNGWKPAG